MAGASGKKLDDTYKLAWLRGLKTTYYLRTQSATHAEKSTVHVWPLECGLQWCNQARPKCQAHLTRLPQPARAQMDSASNVPATDIKFCGD